MPLHEGLAKLTARLFGRREAPSPAKAWLARREKATPEEVIRQHFAAMTAHDLDWLLATMSPERARLYDDIRTVDKRRLSIAEAGVISITPAEESVPMSAFVQRYRSNMVVKVEYELHLTEAHERRDPTIQEGRNWAYFVLVCESRGKPWLIADWGR